MVACFSSVGLSGHFSVSGYYFANLADLQVSESDN